MDSQCVSIHYPVQRILIFLLKYAWVATHDALIKASRKVNLWEKHRPMNRATEAN